MKYQILQESTAEALEFSVTNAIANGWELQGGVTVCVGVCAGHEYEGRKGPGRTDDEWQYTYVQAMINRE